MLIEEIEIWKKVGIITKWKKENGEYIKDRDIDLTDLKIEVSTYGNIRKTLSNNKIRILSDKCTNGGKYIVNNLRVNGVSIVFLRHQLIGQTFLTDKIEGHNTIDHIDGNPSNNHISNLRWMLNIINKILGSIKNIEIHGHKTIMMDKDHNILESFNSMRALRKKIWRI